MIEAFKLVGSISLKGGEKVRGLLGKINDTVGQSERNFNSLGRGLKVAGGALLTAGAGLGLLGGALIKTGISYNAMQEQSEVAWTTLLGTSEKAQEQMKGIAEFARTTPFETEHVDQMAKYMHNAGLEGQNLFDELMKVSDVSSAFAIPAHEAKEMARQMSQVRNAGVAYTEDLKILEERGVPIMKAIASNLGITTAEAKKMASEGKITSEIYLEAFNGIAKGVEGASEKQSETFNGMISSMSDSAKMLAGILTDKLFGKISGFMTKVSDALNEMVVVLQEGGSIKDALATFMPEEQAQTIVDILNGIKDAFQWILDNWEIIVSALAGITGAFLAFHIITNIVKAIQLFNALMVALRTGMVMSTLATWGFNTALLANPITWIAIAIGALIAVIVLLWLNWDKVSAWLQASWKKIKTIASSTWSSIKTSVSGAGEKIATTWNNTKEKVVKYFTDLHTKAREKFDAIKEKARTAFNGARDSIVNPIQTAYEKVKGWIEKIKGFFTNLKLKIPKPSMPSMPSFSLKTSSKTILGKTISYPSGINVKWNAQGGVFDRATLFGAGEAGNEALVPLEGKHMYPMAQAISKFLAGPGNGGQGTRSIEVPVYLNGREIARAIAPNIDTEIQRNKTIRERGI